MIIKNIASIKIFILTVFLLICAVLGSCFAEEIEQNTDNTGVLLGITPFPKGTLSEWSDEAFTDSYGIAKEGGVAVAVWRSQWGDTESTIGNYNWTKDIEFQVYKTKQQGMKYSLVIEIIHTNLLGKYPADLKFKRFDHPVFVKHFKNFVRELLKRYNGKIDYLWLGNEANIYLHNNPQQIKPFLTLCREIVNEIKAIDPGITVGIVGAYHTARNNKEIKLLQDFAGIGDAIGLTIYMEDDNLNSDVLETVKYFNEVMDTFPGKKVAIIETSWSSEGAKGGLEKQSEYVREISKVINNHKDKLVFFSWLLLYDLPDELNRLVVSSFGIDIQRPEINAFLNWHGSLGLFNKDGSEKPAWLAWKQYMARE